MTKQQGIEETSVEGLQRDDWDSELQATTHTHTHTQRSEVSRVPADTPAAEKQEALAGRPVDTR